MYVDEEDSESMDCHFLMTIIYFYITYIYTVYIILSIYNNIYI